MMGSDIALYDPTIQVPESSEVTEECIIYENNHHEIGNGRFTLVLILTHA